MRAVLWLLVTSGVSATYTAILLLFVLQFSFSALLSLSLPTFLFFSFRFPPCFPSLCLPFCSSVFVFRPASPLSAYLFVLQFSFSALLSLSLPTFLFFSFRFPPCFPSLCLPFCSSVFVFRPAFPLSAYLFVLQFSFSALLSLSLPTFLFFSFRFPPCFPSLCLAFCSFLI